MEGSGVCDGQGGLRVYALVVGSAWVRWLDCLEEAMLWDNRVYVEASSFYLEASFLPRRVCGFRCKLPWLNLNPRRVGYLRIDCRVFPANSEVVHAHIIRRT